MKVKILMSKYKPKRPEKRGRCEFVRRQAEGPKKPLLLRSKYCQNCEGINSFVWTTDYHDL